MKIMILSVGGSPDPIVKAIKAGRPDQVYFFCSRGPKGSEHTIAGPGNPCGDTRKVKCNACGNEQYLGDPKGKAIAVQAGLDESCYEIVSVDNPDDLEECYATLRELLTRIEGKYGARCDVVANYTGGTKTMSIAMALAGLMTECCDLAVNIGPRSDLIKVRHGDAPVAVDKWRIFGELQVELARKIIGDFDYANAYLILSEILKRPLDKDFKAKILKAVQLCEAFDLWDKFEHAKACELLASCNVPLPSHHKAIKAILGQSRKANGYELVGELLNNAARKAHRRNYDDAVARLYRAMELFAQIRLKKQFDLDSGSIPLEGLPETLQGAYKSRVRENNKLILGLNDVYELLGKLSDPVGKAYEGNRERILNSLSKRNNSLFAHGTAPLEEEDYQEVLDNLGGFLTGTARMIGVDIDLPQLPQAGIV
ncbi:MAG: TIGR02710 family CRISPR-associated CARF protein [Pseudomonadota bacterium]|nr:TIGR02710 family CRISPR-associated CARF protein [Pseudomonadota bacterium]